MIGERRTFYIKTATGSDAPIELHPNWGYNESDVNIRTSFDSQTGALSNYTIVGSATRYVFPMNFIQENQKNTFNGWWEDRTELDLMFNSSSDIAQTAFVLDSPTNGVLDSSSVFLDGIQNIFSKNVKISNLEKPFTILIDGIIDEYDGVLNFITT